jgi:hypothetical protein
MNENMDSVGWLVCCRGREMNYFFSSLSLSWVAFKVFVFPQPSPRGCCSLLFLLSFANNKHKELSERNCCVSLTIIDDLVIITTSGGKNPRVSNKHTTMNVRCRGTMRKFTLG